jgi:NADH-quinone oxidoreductase subunit G
MIKQGGEWITVDWKHALDFVAHALKDVAAKHGGAALGALVSPHSTLEEMTLAARLMRGLGSDNVDFRLRQTDFRGNGQSAGIPWLGLPVAELNMLDRVLVVGSFLRKDHPLIAQRLRQAAKKGTQVSMLHAVADDWLLPLAHAFVTAPSLLPAALAEIVVAAARGAGQPVPPALAGVEPSDRAQAIAASLATGERKAILLGNLAEQHPEASQLLALAQALAGITGATLGCLTEAANSVGGYVAGALPQAGGLDARAMLENPRRAYVLLNAEPAFDCANPVAARAALGGAEFVAVLSPFRHGADYASVLLPIGPFTETAGTFVSCEGRAQRFNGVVKPLGEARPAWKVLRVLGSLLGLPDFDFATIEDVRASMPGKDGDIATKLGNGTRVAIAAPQGAAAGLERVADVPIHFADPLARRAPALQETADAAPPRARMNAAMLQQLGVAAGDEIRIRQGRGEAVLTAAVDAAVPEGVVRIAAAHPLTCALEGLSGPITVVNA